MRRLGGKLGVSLGDWHLISLNIECADEPGGCSTMGSWFASETKWLAQDLNEDHSRCTLACWHQPTFSSTSGTDPSAGATWTTDSNEGETADAWWKLLYAHRATLILNGHDHVYSRFAPLDPGGRPHTPTGESAEGRRGKSGAWRTVESGCGPGRSSCRPRARC